MNWYDEGYICENRRIIQAPRMFELLQQSVTGIHIIVTGDACCHEK